MKKQALLSILLVGTSLAIYAQTDTLQLYSFSEIFNQNDWLKANNPIGISFQTLRPISIAEATYSYRNGNYGNVSVPASTHLYSIYAESFQTLKNVSLHGKLSYTRNQLNTLNWHGMTGDYWKTVNLCDSIRGNQASEQYQLIGAFAVPLHKHWLIGAQFDYLVQFTSKDIDPRNKNQWMEWRLSPGIGYQQKKLRLGLSIFYIQRKETVHYMNLDTHVTQLYMAAYPLGFYKTLPRGGNIDWHYNGQEAGVTLQASFANRSMEFFQQWKINAIRQSVISDEVKNKEEGDAKAWQMEYSGKLRKLNTGTIRSEWNLKINYYQSQSYDPLQQQQENNIWQSHGRVLRSIYQEIYGKFTYGHYRLRNPQTTYYSFLTGIDYGYSKNSLLFYPTEFAQPIHHLSIYSTASRTFLLPKALLKLSVKGQLQKGWGDLLNEEQSSAEDHTPTITLWQREDRRRQEFFYRTAARWSAHADLEYTHAGLLNWFVRLSGDYEQVIREPLLGNQWILSAHIGVMF